MINIVKDIDLVSEVRKYDVILIGTGIKNSQGNGFQHKIAVTFKYAYQELNKTKYDDKSKFGNCLVIPQKFENPIFIYCFIDKGRYKSNLYPDSVNYDALESCLNLVKKNFSDKKIASTIMGVDNFEGGGDREKIISIFEKELSGCDVTLYDYKQIDFRIENNTERKQLLNDYFSGKITKEEYDRKRIIFAWKVAYGMYSLPPEGLNLIKFKKLYADKEVMARYLKDNGYDENGVKL